MVDRQTTQPEDNAMRGTHHTRDAVKRTIDRTIRILKLWYL